MALVSIILPYYKKSEYVKSTINSILDQTYQNFEIILIDDELSEESKKVLNDLKDLDKRITVIENSKNLGAGYSRNEGIKVSKGDFLAFCDCDDLWDKKKLDYQLSFMKSLNIDVCHTSYDILNEFGKIIGSRVVSSELRFNDLLKSCDIGLSTVLIKKKILTAHNAYFPNLKTKEDYVLWLKLSKEGIIFFGLDEKLVKWRKIKDSLSSSSIQKIFDGYKVYRHFLNFSFLNSVIRLFILSINFILKR